jgi:aspartyl-tRNA(Asn)/glutamyl-tRNA(Gln) amidotransferase subunit C
MSLNDEAVAKIARLARLRIDPSQLSPMAGELNNILDFVAQLDGVDVAGVPPMTSVVAMTLRLREDAVTDGGNAAKVLRNAPQSEAGFFTVPKVIE